MPAQEKLRNALSDVVLPLIECQNVIRVIDEESLHPVDFAGMIGGQFQRQQRAHREATHEDVLALIAKQLQRVLERAIPVGPARPPQLLQSRAVSRELRTSDRQTGGGKFSDKRLHLGRCAGDYVREEDFRVASLLENVVAALKRQDAPARRKRPSHSSL